MRRLVPPHVGMKNMMEATLVSEQAVEEWAWHARGACRGADPEMFFPSTDDAAVPAKLICDTCPVRLACLAFALERNERFGVWGGLTERERGRLTPAVREQIVREATAA